MRTEESIASVVDEFDRVVGLERPAFAARQRLGDAAGLQPRPARQPRRRRDRGGGIAAFLCEPRFEGLPAIFEGPGFKGKNVEPEDIENMINLRKRGVTARSKR